MLVFFHAPRSGSQTVERRGVGPATTPGVVDGFKNEEYLESGPFLSLSATPQSVTQSTFGRRGFRTVQVHTREGECLDSFCLNVDASARVSRLTSTTRSET